MDGVTQWFLPLLIKVLNAKASNHRAFTVVARRLRDGSSSNALKHPDFLGYLRTNRPGGGKPDTAHPNIRPGIATKCKIDS